MTHRPVNQRENDTVDQSVLPGARVIRCATAGDTIKPFYPVHVHTYHAEIVNWTGSALSLKESDVSFRDSRV